jgi:protein arginine N-methyltransferase 1
MALLETLASQFVRCKRLLASNASWARAMRAVELRNAFDKIQMHEEMLADKVRMMAYHAAIQRHVTSQDCVVDVGTGTGVLALFAAAKNPRKIYALDHSKTMVNYAKAIAEANGITNVTFVACSSYKFRPPEPIDVILQEQMGYVLFEEEMLEIILDVRDRCLKPGGRILPAAFEFYLEPVQLRKQERIPFIQDQRVQRLNFPRPPIELKSGYYLRWIDPEDVEFLLCDPGPVFAFNLTTLTLDQIPKQFSASKPVKQAGQLDGICMYFKAIFDDDISLSTGPEAAKTHWWMLLYRTPQRLCQVGQVFTMQVEAPDLAEPRTWSWRIDMKQRGEPSVETDVIGRKHETAN